MVCWVFLHLQCPDGVCIGWACALWLQRLFYVDSKGDVKEFFGLRFGRFSGSCPDGVCVFLHLQCLHGVCIGWALCSVAPKIVLRGCFYLDCINCIKLCGFQR